MRRVKCALTGKTSGKITIQPSPSTEELVSPGVGKDSLGRGTGAKAVRTLPICERATNSFYDGKCEEASGESNEVNCRRKIEEDQYRRCQKV